MIDFDAIIEKADTIGIAGHVRPDGDCVGSCLAVYNYIRTYFPHKDTTLYLEPIPNTFAFLSGAENIVNDYPAALPHDLFIALDCGDIHRLGNAVLYFEAASNTVCVDHHVSNTGYAEENYIVPDASSTCEIIFELLPYEKITKEIAECLYNGIVHDTGVFQYDCTSSKTMNIAGKLMDKGIDFTKIVDDTFYTKTYKQNRILGYALLKSKLYLDGQCVFCMLSEADMKEYDVSPKDFDGIVNQLRVTKDIKVAVFLYESESGVYKASLRSKCDLDVADLAMSFDGGGHAKAAGFTIVGTAERVTERIVERIRERL